MAIIKAEHEIQALRDSGVILGKAMKHVLSHVQPGITTEELDELFVNIVQGLGAEPSFLGYQGYPKSICTSVNNQVVHAIPGKRQLQEGDIIGVDCGVRYNGYCTDMARTVAVGKITIDAEQLIDVAAESLRLGIAQLQPGNFIGDIGAAIQTYVESHGYSVVRVLVGHGVGEEVHEDPQVPNYGKSGTGMQLQPGMVLAVEPMVNMGAAEVVFEDDGWTVSTADGTLSAHSEDTILITENGPEVLTI